MFSCVVRNLGTVKESYDMSINKFPKPERLDSLDWIDLSCLKEEEEEEE
jgi:hypothetical protein